MKALLTTNGLVDEPALVAGPPVVGQKGMWEEKEVTISIEKNVTADDWMKD